MGNDVVTQNQSAVAKIGEPSASVIEVAMKLPPRDLIAVEKKLRATVTSNAKLAELCIYCKPVGKSRVNGLQQFVTGSSVRFAEVGQQCYERLWVQGNVDEIDKAVSATVICFDLSSLNITSGTCSKSIFGRNGRYSDTMVENTKNACLSIARRNAIEQQMRPQLEAVMDDIKHIIIDKWCGSSSNKNVKTALSYITSEYRKRWGTTNDDLAKITSEKSDEEEKIVLLVGIRNYLLDNPDKYKEVFGRDPTEFKKNEKITPAQEFQTIKFQLISIGKGDTVNEIVKGLVDVSGNSEDSFSEADLKECIKQMKEELNKPNTQKAGKK